MILDWIAGYQVPFDSIPSQKSFKYNNNLGISNFKIISIEIDKLLKLGSITQCDPIADQFLSNIFTIPKNDGSHRLILNLKSLNKFITPEHFKLEDIRVVSKLLTKGNFMCTIDIKNAYHLVPLHKDYKKYFRFMFNRKLYEFNCLPFGLATAPFVFTKLLKPAIECLRNQGVILVTYLDDIICLGSSYKVCLYNMKMVISVLECLGFVINYSKSRLVPVQVIDYLGFTINSNNMTLSPTLKKCDKLKKLIDSFLKLNSCSIRDFARLLGNLTSVCIAVSYGFVYTKLMEKEKFLALQAGNENFEYIMLINEEVKNDLLWWKSKLLKPSNYIKQYNFIAEIYSDASGTGWGAFCNGEVANGYWSEKEKMYHINFLELLAAFFALQCFAKSMTNCEILLRIDNTTAISCINRMGSVQHIGLNNLSRSIWKWCEIRGIWIFASYIKSKDNIEADRESRHFNIDTEWELSTEAYHMITNEFGIPEIDLFATRINAKCIKYVSWHRDPFAFNIDAFTIKWNKYFFYAFPPFCLMLRVIQKIKLDKAEGLIIFPIWKSQPWYPILKSMVISKIITLKPSKNLLMSPFRTPHPLHAHLTLGVCILSGKLLKEESCPAAQLI